MNRKKTEKLICALACVFMTVPTPLYAKTKQKSKSVSKAVIKKTNKKTKKAKKIKLNFAKLKLIAGKTKKLKLKNSKGKIKWSTSDKKIATVSKNGKVKAVKAGKAKITAKVKKKKYVCKVTVINKASPIKKTKKKKEIIKQTKNNGNHYDFSTDFKENEENIVTFNDPRDSVERKLYVSYKKDNGANIRDSSLFKDVTITSSDPDTFEIDDIERDDSGVSAGTYTCWKEGNVVLTVSYPGGQKKYNVTVKGSDLYQQSYEKVKPLINAVNASNYSLPQKAFVILKCMNAYYDKQILNNGYLDKYDNSCIASVILGEKGVCGTFSETYIWLLSLVGIKARGILTNGTPEGHEFVQIQYNGNWYNVDTIVNLDLHNDTFMLSDMPNPNKEEEKYSFYNNPYHKNYYSQYRYCAHYNYNVSEAQEKIENSNKYLCTATDLDNVNWMTQEIKKFIEDNRIFKDHIVLNFPTYHA